MKHIKYLCVAFVHTLGMILSMQAYADEALARGGVSPELHSRVQKMITADSRRITDIFKDIHQNPELGFMEIRTAGIVAHELEALGFDVKQGIGKTGVLALLRNGEGPTILYRTDMDALAVRETTDLPYASKVRVTRATGIEVPVGHMCGHDAHVSWMLGMARTMVALKEQWSGTLVIVAQPAEELLSGAKAMIDDGLYQKYAMPKPEAMVALHTAPVATGTIINAGGIRFAGTDQLDVTFSGIGGHGSMPQKTKDPVLMAASAVVQYQSIISRSIDPQQAAVLTVGSIQAGEDNNVIPETALLKINLRWFSETVRQQLLNGIHSINHSIAIASDLPKNKMPVVVMKGFSTPLNNDQKLTDRLNNAFAEIVDKKQLIDKAPAVMGSEDAHILLGPHTNVPLDYIFIGVANEKAFEGANIKAPFFNHNGNFMVDLEAIPFGTRIATVAMLELLAK